MNSAVNILASVVAAVAAWYFVRGVATRWRDRTRERQDAHAGHEFCDPRIGCITRPGGTMNDDYTPTTENVRDSYAYDPEAEYHDPVNYAYAVAQAKREFNRWLAQERAKAWDSAIYHVEPMLSSSERRAAHADNPYREGK